MKALYSTLATVALLFSQTWLAENLAQKAGQKVNNNAPKAWGQSPADKVNIEKSAPKAKAPICYTGG